MGKPKQRHRKRRQEASTNLVLIGSSSVVRVRVIGGHGVLSVQWRPSNRRPPEALFGACMCISPSLSWTGASAARELRLAQECHVSADRKSVV